MFIVFKFRKKNPAPIEKYYTLETNPIMPIPKIKYF